MRRRGVFLFVWAAVCVAQQLPLENADFSAWQDGLPEAWQLSLGAGDPNGRASRVLPLADGGLALEGDAATGAWQLLSQPFQAEAGSVYSLRFQARVRELRREANQYRNGYLGLVFRGPDGALLARQVWDVRNAAWQSERLLARAPEGATAGEVALFLSMSGRLEVERLELSRLLPEDSFELLAAEMDRHYSFFALKGFDWQAQVDAYRERALAADEPQAFAGLLLEMLAPLEDPHVWLRLSGEPLQVPWHETPVGNFALPACLAALAEVQHLGRFGLVGRSEDGIGYLCVASLQLSEEDYLRLENALRGLLDCPALVLDLRVNGGGNERWAQQLVGLLCDQPRVYARARRRNGPGHDDFAPAWDRVLQPSAEAAYAGPLAVLLGPGCMSSGEGMALMLQALPGAQLVGQPSRGASGNPAWLALPNGVEVAFSRWQSLEPDGSCIEGRGVQPDVLVEPSQDGDATLEKAFELLRAALR